MRHLLVLSLFSIFAFGCKTDLSGTLNLTSTLTVQHEIREQLEESETWKTVTSNLKPGNYDAKISLSGCCNFSLTINPGSWRRQIFQMTLPKNATLPSGDGDFYLRGQDIKQEFDLSGNIKTHTTKSDIIKRHESCQYQDVETICDSRGCFTHTVWRTGWQWTEFYTQTQTINMRASFKPRGQTSDLGTFKGHESTRERIILYQTPCR